MGSIGYTSPKKKRRSKNLLFFKMASKLVAGAATGGRTTGAGTAAPGRGGSEFGPYLGVAGTH